MSRRLVTIMFTPDKRPKAYTFKRALRKFYSDEDILLDEIDGHNTLYVMLDGIAYNEEDFSYLIGRLLAKWIEQRRRLGLPV